MKKCRYLTVGSVLVGNLLFLSILILSKWPKYWEHINYEYSHLTWLSSVNLLLVGIFCLLCFLLRELIQKENSFSLHRFIMPILGLGFIVLSLDEKFQIHEKLREKIFIPNEIGTNISGVGAGDFLHILIAIVGIGISYFVYKKIKSTKTSLTFYSLALVMALISVITDTTSPVIRDDSKLSPSELMASINHQFTEEIFETLAIFFFLSCFINFFFVELSNLIKKRD